MMQHGGRRLRDGRVVAVSRNGGIRKICGCARRVWSKCPHPWHINFHWRGVDFRFSLDRHEGRHLEHRAEAEDVAGRLRREIKDGTFGKPQVPCTVPPGVDVAQALTFSEFADEWTRGRGFQLANARDNAYRLGTICRFVLPGTMPPRSLGDTPVREISVMDIEAFREARKAAKLSAVAINHDLRLLRKMFNWGIRKALIERTPFKIGTEPAISLEREIPRNRRFERDEDEDRLLAACNDHLRAVVTAILDTACRPGEILSLQWADVSLDRREIRILASKEKTRRERIIPISSRLLAVLEMRKLDPSGEPRGATSYVFGNAVGERIKSVGTAWENACAKAKLTGFQLRDLRHEAASRFDEAGMPIIYVSNMLGHSNLSTTSRYLNVRRRGLHLAMENYEKSRHLASSLQDEPSSQTDAASEPDRTGTHKQLVS